jgi:hypothetical protein
MITLAEPQQAKASTSLDYNTTPTKKATDSVTHFCSDVNGISQKYNNFSVNNFSNNFVTKLSKIGKSGYGNPCRYAVEQKTKIADF